MAILTARELPLSLRRHPDAPEIILELLRTGVFLTTACSYAGVSVGSVKSWIETGAHLLGLMEDDPFDPTPEQERLMEIAIEIARAEAFAEKSLVGVISTAAVQNDDWRAAMALLQHRFKERWRPSKELEVSGKMDVSVKEQRALATDLLSALNERLDAIEPRPAAELMEAEVIPDEAPSPPT